MGSIDSLLAGAIALRDGMQGGIIREVLQPHEQDIIEQQRIQLLEGKNSDGEDMHPYYTEDVKPRGYFRTKESAQRYSDWKQTLSYPYSVKRNPNAPNLYITGVFHDDLGVKLDSDSVGIVPDTAYAANIMGKYGKNAFGLCVEKWNVIWNDKGAREELIEKMRKVLWQS